jgi:predicted DNA-binding transcriptional regulator YafY
VVRYSARVAPWVLEHGEAEVQDDGSVVVRLRVADSRWLVRHVLHFAGEAVVLEPEEMREAVTRAAERVAGTAVEA